MSKFYKNIIKRLLDIIFSIFLIFVLLPLFLLISIIIYIDSRTPVIFKQKRVGLQEEIFTIYKFRSMIYSLDKNGNLLPDHLRLTTIGKFLRKYSLDEIPELINVLLGDMSFIGPRPLLPEYLPYYKRQHRYRHVVRPGITGLAQINGRQNIPFSKRFELDCQYINNLSFTLDCKILIKTIFNTIVGKDVNLDQSVDEVDDINLSKDL